jgi:hypothetical protein
MAEGGVSKLRSVSPSSVFEAATGYLPATPSNTYVPVRAYFARRDSGVYLKRLYAFHASLHKSHEQMRVEKFT